MNKKQNNFELNMLRDEIVKEVSKQAFLYSAKNSKIEMLNSSQLKEEVRKAHDLPNEGVCLKHINYEMSEDEKIRLAINLAVKKRDADLIALLEKRQTELEKQIKDLEYKEEKAECQCTEDYYGHMIFLDMVKLSEIQSLLNKLRGEKK